MLYKLFPALPDFLSSTAKKVLLETDLNESTGKLSWPRVLMYEYNNEWGEKIKTAIPPENENSYYVLITNIEAYEYLCKTGWAYDKRHTGRNYQVVDNRLAPGA